RAIAHTLGQSCHPVPRDGVCPMRRHLLPASLIALAAAAAPAAAQTTYTWSGTTGGAWLTPANWAGGPANTYPGTSAAPGAGAATDVALFNHAPAHLAIAFGAAGAPLTPGATH